MIEPRRDGPAVIVAGVDGSPSSLRAGAYAAGLARRQGSLLVVAHIRRPDFVSVADLVVPDASLALLDAADGAEDAVRRQVVEAVERMPEGRKMRWEFRCAVGDAYRGLVRIAEQVQADAVVVGASESAGHRLVGSVAMRLVRAGRWPVTVVP